MCDSSFRYYLHSIILEIMAKEYLQWDSIPTVAVYKKQPKSNTYYMIITKKHPDIVNNGRATKPIIDHKYEIVELGMGGNFVDLWQQKYNIKNPKIIA